MCSTAAQLSVTPRDMPLSPSCHPEMAPELRAAQAVPQGLGAARVGRSLGCRLKEVTLLQSALLRSLSSHGVNGINQGNL